jgi:hypothetical protein
MAATSTDAPRKWAGRLAVRSLFATVALQLSSSGLRWVGAHWAGGRWLSVVADVLFLLSGPTMSLSLLSYAWWTPVWTLRIASAALGIGLFASLAWTWLSIVAR